VLATTTSGARGGVGTPAGIVLAFRRELHLARCLPTAFHNHVTLSRVNDSLALDLDLEGPDVRPETVDARASLGLALALVDALEAIARYEETVEETPFFVTLTAMRGASVHFAFNPVARIEYGQRGLDAFKAAAKRLPVYVRAQGAVPKRLTPQLDKLRLATRNLPSHVVATARIGSDAVVLSELVRMSSAPLLKSAETFRAFILRAGGVHPRVSLRFRAQPKPVTVDVNKALLESQDFKLYREADVTGVFNRDPNSVGMPIVSGHVTELRRADKVDPVDAFDAWYEAAGRPWTGVVDIEAELRNRGRE
jgi:hypothetical protein